MADTILSGRWKVYYSAENRLKKIERDTSVTPTVTDTVNVLYSALQDLFDELTQMDDGVPMSAQTPTEYTIGIIDPGDSDPWFIDRQSVQYLTGGALKTASWKRDLPGDGTGNIGIVKITRTGTNIVQGDVGYDIINSTGGDSGTLLDVNGTTLWIRPDDNTLANDWNSTSGNIVCNGHTDVQASAGVSAGESLWSNIYTLGTIEANTHIFISQNGANLVHYKPSVSTTDWWGDGHIDILINVKELNVENDEGYITVLARQYSKTYSYYIVDLINGGRNPIPLQTGNDLDNQTGYWQFIGSSGTGTFAVGDVIYKATTDKKGVVTAVSGSPGTTPTITYYSIGDPITNFQNGDTTVTNGTATVTIATGPTAFGPSDLAVPPTIVHGGLTGGGSYDIDENGTPENYSIVIDCNQNTLGNVYEYSKYTTRRGETASTNTDGLQGQFYVGSDYRLIYTGSVTGGTIDDGDTVTQETSGAKGTVVYHNTADKIIILRNARGTFGVHASTYTLTSSPGGGSVEIDSSATAVTPIASAPFGTFAGGKFFCAPGVVLTDYLTADSNNFQLVDDNGTVRVAPTKATITVSNTREADKIAVFRLTASGGNINKTEYTATDQAQAATSAIMGSAITTDSPGKSAGGVLRLVDTSATVEYRIRFSSWTGSTFTLAYTDVASALGDTTTTIVHASGIGTASLVGDLVMNVDRSFAVAYVTAVTDADHVTISPAITGQVPTDHIKFNCLPVATVDAAPGPADYWYVPFIDVYETTGTLLVPGSESITITHATTDPDIFIRVRARQAGQILPFEQDTSVVGVNPTNVSVVRTADTIFVA